MMKALRELNFDLLAIAPSQSILDEMNINDVNKEYDNDVAEFKMAVKLLSETINKKDGIAIQCALTRIRISSLNLSNIYLDIIDDVTLISNHESWPAIPDDYKLYEEYNYPKK